MDKAHMLSRAVVQPKPNRPSGLMLHDCTWDTTNTCAAAGHRQCTGLLMLAEGAAAGKKVMTLDQTFVTG